MTSADLPRASRIETAKALQVLGKALRHWKNALVVDCDPAVGRFDESACRAAQQDAEAAWEAVQEIYCDTMADTAPGLFGGALR